MNRYVTVQNVFESLVRTVRDARNSRDEMEADRDRYRRWRSEGEDWCDSESRRLRESREEVRAELAQAQRQLVEHANTIARMAGQGYRVAAPVTSGGAPPTYAGVASTPPAAAPRRLAAGDWRWTDPFPNGVPRHAPQTGTMPQQGPQSPFWPPSPGADPRGW